MRAAGFDRREAMVVGAMSQGGKIGQALIDLGQEVNDRHRLTQSVKAVLRTPKMLLLGIYLFMPVLVSVIAPRIMQFFSNLGGASLKIPLSVQLFYDFVTLCLTYPLPAIAAYLALPVGSVLTTRSQTFQRLINAVKPVRELNLAIEHTGLWSAYAMMFSAGIPPANICETLSQTVKRESTAQALLRMAKHSRAGDDDANAVAAAGFPERAVANFRSAAKSGSLAKGLAQFTRDLKDDAQWMTQRLSENVQLLCYVLMGMLVIALFMVTIYPISVPLIESL
jgi:type II secretory pathway component PulF